MTSWLLNPEATFLLSDIALVFDTAIFPFLEALTS